jgi:hypothetical protein
MRVWPMDRVAAATCDDPLANPVATYLADIAITASPGCSAFAAPGGDVVVEARPPQPIVISQSIFCFFLAVAAGPGPRWGPRPATPCSIPKGGPEVVTPSGGHRIRPTGGSRWLLPGLPSTPTLSTTIQGNVVGA